jgi:hypothetical protein
MPRMFSLFPNNDAPLSHFFGLHAEWLILFGVTMIVCTLLALYFGPTSPGLIDFGSPPNGADCSGDGGDGSCGD